MSQTRYKYYRRTQNEYVHRPSKSMNIITSGAEDCFYHWKARRCQPAPKYAFLLVNIHGSNLRIRRVNVI